MNIKQIFPAIVLSFISLIVLSSIDFFYFKIQFFYLLIALLAFVCFLKINLDLISDFYIPIYFISVLMLLFVLFLGHASHGAVRWFNVFGLSLQFSELLKPFLAISLAKFISGNRSLKYNFFVSFIFLFFVSFLIFKQPDLGSALVYGLSFFLALFLIGFPKVYFLTIFMPLILLFPLIWNFFLHSYQKARILSFLKLSYDPLGASYNMIQSIISIGSGQLYGKGFMLGTQSALHFLPERHTDFIFATLSEEMGFLGSFIVIFLAGLLFFNFFKLILKLENGFNKNLTIISFSVIFIEFILNAGMNMGVLPVVGVAMPFVSYGGSSLVSSFIFLAFIVKIGIIEKSEKVIEIK